MIAPVFGVLASQTDNLGERLPEIKKRMIFQIYKFKRKRSFEKNIRAPGDRSGAPKTAGLYIRKEYKKPK